ncbi:conserved hypothetical protein [Treponema primitia ZAS-2]|uniref:Lipopolysaccharide assembly protein A domain-containing protein n=1 Tax=Treponema primitia (strain ATCC BAA-887 / DSM 12427 / ZAS-2) TaxID=545694 RepID=F5YMT9_TREPZ|nr:hypothetical protein [Treponema primitia]AEF86003.1 conserved hypothetical protein [Treponema primitia ZAS-2]
MPWRLIGLVLILVIFLVFIGLNLDNRCDISFGFSTLPAVPVYLPIFASFVFGLLCSIPFAVSMELRRAKKNKEAKAGEFPVFDIPGMPPPKKRGKGAPGDFPNGGPYGID